MEITFSVARSTHRQQWTHKGFPPTGNFALDSRRSSYSYDMESDINNPRAGSHAAEVFSQEKRCLHFIKPLASFVPQFVSLLMIPHLPFICVNE